MVWLSSIIVYTRRTIFSPLLQVTYSYREGYVKVSEIFELTSYNRNDELTDILTNLQQFQAELGELDGLRENEQKIQGELLVERDNANQSFKQLQDTQSKLNCY